MVSMDVPLLRQVSSRTYRHVFVDEAQDLNSVQYATLRVLGEQATSVMLVGDPPVPSTGFFSKVRAWILGFI